MVQGNPNHPGVCCLPLALFVLGVLADDHDATATTDDAALLAHFANGGSDFHDD